MTTQKARAVASQDQAWAGARRRQPDIERISNGGFDGSECDRMPAAYFASLVMGRLHMLAAEANDTEDGQ